MSAPTSTNPGGDAGSKVGDTAHTAQESGQAVASTAAEHAKDLSGSATQKASEVVSEAKDKASDLLGETRTQVQAEAENRRGQAVSTLRSLGDELDAMQDHGGDKGLATQLASRGGDYVRQTADWLDGREPSEILDDVRRFARRRPGTFLLGALLAGVVAGRFTRSLKAGAPDSSAPSHAAAQTPPSPVPAPVSSPSVSAPPLDADPFVDPVLPPVSQVASDDLTAPLPNRSGGVL
jgi:hypothetical protein